MIALLPLLMAAAALDREAAVAVRPSSLPPDPPAPPAPPAPPPRLPGQPLPDADRNAIEQARARRERRNRRRQHEAAAGGWR